MRGSPVSLFAWMCLAYLRFTRKVFHIPRDALECETPPTMRNAQNRVYSPPNPHGAILNSSIANAQRMHRQFHRYSSTSSFVLLWAVNSGTEYGYDAFGQKLGLVCLQGRLGSATLHYGHPQIRFASAYLDIYQAVIFPALSIISALFEGWLHRTA